MTCLAGMVLSVDLEIICVGNELLIGKTLNTNASWMAKRATSLGVSVKRITVVGDDITEIATAVTEALERKPKFVVTTGGLGPTFDDKTLEGIAEALKRKTEVNERALSMVKAKYDDLARQGNMEKAELTPSRIKMAKLPEDAEPLPNPVGTAPAVLVHVNETSLLSLPGVPSEMEAIFEQSIVPMLKNEAGDIAFFESSIFVDDIMESMVAPLIDRTMRENPFVYIKSHPKGGEDKPHIELHFSTTAKNKKTAIVILDKAVTQLCGLIEKSGGRIRTARKQNTSG